jgi:imidazolonepropionase-like amidohydrolase
MSSPQALRNVHIVDAETASVSRDRSVVLRDGRVEAILHASTELPGPVVDGAGLYLCPGLIDCHVHLFLDASSSPRTTFLESDDAAKMAVAERNACVAIESGITTVRDCGAPAALMFQFRRLADSGAIPAPHIVSCGSPLMRPGGHCHFFGGEVGDNDDVRRTIESQLRQGADFVKLMASGGGLTPGTDPGEADLPLELMTTAVDVAHAHGVTVTAHCHATESIVRAIDAGLDMIEHCSFVEPHERYRYSEDITRRIRDNDIVVSPTVYGALRTAQRFRNSADPANDRNVTAIDRLEGRLTNAAHFVRLGLSIIGGTDSGVTDTPFDSLLDELLCYTRVGMSNADALRSVTTRSAAAMGLRSVGSVAPGYWADFVLVADNPLDDLNALRDPLTIYKRGQVVHRRPHHPASYKSDRLAAGS